jgi:TolB protein
LARGQRDIRRQVWIVRANGTNKQDISRLTCPSPNKPYAPDKCSGDLLPAWSPDGSRIAFSRHLGSPVQGTTNLFVMNADGTDPQQITFPGERYEDFSPQWSSDGTKLVFTRFDRQRGKDAVVTVWLEGTHEQRLTPWIMNAGDGPDWSPDDRWILFRAHLDQCHPQTNIWMIHPNGTGLRQITDSVGCTTGWISSSFSPDGKKIVTSTVPGVGKAGQADVVVLSLEGAVLRNVTKSVDWESFADWGPQP